MKIVVLAGGLSTERHVSLVSGLGVCKALRENGHKAIFVDMYFGLEEYQGKLENVFDAPDGLMPKATIENTAPDLAKIKSSRKMKGESIVGDRVLDVCAMADIVFLALHGECGEDGRIQAALDLMGVPYTGSSYVGSAMAMDKSITKRFMDSEGILTAPWKNVIYEEKDIPHLVEEIEVPCAVKVVNGGSSIGVELPETKEDLEKALKNILQFGNHVIVEKKIQGRELTIAVLGDTYLPAVEIIPKVAYFDYVAKYQNGASEEICPADISKETWNTIGKAALKLHKALGLGVYSRTDFILDKEGKAWCLEVNTLPGMTPNSLVPKEARAVGMSYNDLCERIIQDSLLLRKGEKE